MARRTACSLRSTELRPLRPGHPDDFLGSGFSPAELEEIYKTGAIARSVGLNTNPSGTAAVSGAMADVQKPLSSLAPKPWRPDWLTNSPRFNRWLMRSGAPVTGAAAGTTIPLSVLLGLSASQNQQWADGHRD
jgi:hypothetical protein